jgi:tRNA pseudouridine55 synthase
MSVNGVLLMDKDEGLTSHGVVEHVREILGQQRVGHTGTLDPMATGLLPLCLGKATRLSQFLTSSDKSYEGTIRFGMSTDTHDRDGKPLGPARAVRLQEAELRQAIAALTGSIQQIPPLFSAKKHGGVPLYRFARRNMDVARDPVRVTIHHLRVLDVRPDEVDFEVRSSPGTYIRVLAHDLGELLGTGAFLKNLRRVACGAFHISHAHSLDDLRRIVGSGALESAVVSMEKIPLGFGTVVANRLGMLAVRNGRVLGVREILPSRSCLSEGLCRVESETGELLAIGKVMKHAHHDIPMVQPQIVFPAE